MRFGGILLKKGSYLFVYSNVCFFSENQASQERTKGYVNSRIGESENDNTSLLLKQIEELSKRIEKLEKKIA